MKGGVNSTTGCLKNEKEYPHLKLNGCGFFHEQGKKVMKGFVATVGIVLLTASAGSAKTIHVPGDSSTIQSGLNGELAGDTVLVADGIYTGEGNKNLDFLGKAVVVRTQNGPDSTIIDCEAVGRGFDFHYGEGFDSKLQGFTIRNGYASSGLGGLGGGIVCDNSSPIICSCIIMENRARYDGGGIYCAATSMPIITDCIIIKNRCYDWGGGLACAHSSPIVNRCSVMENRARLGGGIYCYHSNATFTQCTISGNEVYTGDAPSAAGGGVYSEDSSPVFNSCIISGNRARASLSPPLQHWAWGGGICCDSATIVNCTISGNIASTGAGGIFVTSSTSITSCVLWDDSWPEIEFGFGGNTVVSYSNIQGGWPGEGNIDENPLFRDPDNDDFHLMATYCGDPYDSPCIDAGDPNILDEVLDCWHGLGTDRSDMGAYGGSNAGWPTAVEEDKNEVTLLPKEVVLHQNYPNPFNSETVVSYSLHQSGRVTLSVYNILGQRVATLFEGIQETGLHNVVWNAADFSSGIYFARLEAGGHSKTVKMVLLK